MKMLETAGVPVQGAEAVVIGRSNIVGKPMATLLTNAGATVTVCHSRTKDLAFHTAAPTSWWRRSTSRASSPAT